MKTFVIAVVLLTCGSAPWGAKRAGAQGVGDSCFTLDINWHPRGWYNTDSLQNPDSILVDSCHSDSAHMVFWIKRGYVVEFSLFTPKVISLPWAPADSDVEVTWRAIDTAYPTLRAAFDSIESRFGSFMLKKETPNDTSSVGSQDFYLNFSNYVLFDSIDPVISSIDGVFAYFGWPMVLFDVTALPLESTKDCIYPNPAGNALFVHLNGESDPVSLVVFDALGRIVQKSSTFSRNSDARIDLSNLITGEYFLQIKNIRVPFIHKK